MLQYFSVNLFRKTLRTNILMYRCGETLFDPVLVLVFEVMQTRRFTFVFVAPWCYWPFTMRLLDTRFLIAFKVSKFRMSAICHAKSRSPTRCNVSNYKDAKVYRWWKHVAQNMQVLHGLKLWPSSSKRTWNSFDPGGLCYFGKLRVAAPSQEVEKFL